MPTASPRCDYEKVRNHIIASSPMHDPGDYNQPFHSTVLTKEGRDNSGMRFLVCIRREQFNSIRANGHGCIAHCVIREYALGPGFRFAAGFYELYYADYLELFTNAGREPSHHSLFFADNEELLSALCLFHSQSYIWGDIRFSFASEYVALTGGDNKHLTYEDASVMANWVLGKARSSEYQPWVVSCQS